MYYKHRYRVGLHSNVYDYTECSYFVSVHNKCMLSLYITYIVYYLKVSISLNIHMRIYINIIIYNNILCKIHNLINYYKINDRNIGNTCIY